MSHRYDDMRDWLNPYERESRWSRELTNTEMLAISVAYLACLAGVVVFAVVVLRW